MQVRGLLLALAPRALGRLASLRMDQLPGQRWAEPPLGLGRLGLERLGLERLGLERLGLERLGLGRVGLEREPSMQPRLRGVLNRRHCRAY